MSGRASAEPAMALAVSLPAAGEARDQQPSAPVALAWVSPKLHYLAQRDSSCVIALFSPFEAM